MVQFFNKESGYLMLDEVVQQSPEFQKIMADGEVTDEEVAKQAELVIGLLKEIEAQLSEQDKELVVKTISELAVLYEISARIGGRNGNL
jgi:DNA-directed RNA polymerase specialized sigma subunit